MRKRIDPQAIRQRRQQLGVTQKTLAERVGIGKDQLCRWELSDFGLSKKKLVCVEVALDDLALELQAARFIEQRDAALLRVARNVMGVR